MMNWRDTFDETIRDGIFALLVLQVLSEGDKDRRELHREIGVRTDGAFCRSNSLKMAIQRLLLQKWVTSYVTPINEAHERTLYHIEESGRDYLEYGRKHLKHVTDALRLFFEWRTPSEDTNEESPLS